MGRILLAGAFLLHFVCIDAYSQENQQGLNPLNISTDRQLFIDDFIVEKLGGGAQYRLHHPERKEVVIRFTEPWEGTYSNYPSIFKDGDTYKMYYRGWDRTDDGKIGHDMVWCYAESKDGIHWIKPSLNLFEFNGSKDNNIVLASGKLGAYDFTLYDNITVFKDHNPDVSPDALYKAFVDDRKSKERKWTLLAFKSADGIHWSPMNNGLPVLTDGSFDSQNTAFWDTERNEYRAYWRFFAADSTRGIRTGTSKDFIHWDIDSDIKFRDTVNQQMYTNGIVPYYRAPQIYIGFAARYIDRKWSLPMKALPEPEERKNRSKTQTRFGTALTESVLIAGHDGVSFKRWNEAFLRPGIERPGTWNYGQQYIAWSLVTTKSDIEDAPDEISIYASEDLWTGKGGSSLRRYTIRQDGFVSVNAPLSGGTVLTKPFLFNGKSLSLNLSTSAYGSVRVAILQPNGEPMPGFDIHDCEPVFGDTIDRTVNWTNGSDLSFAEGKEIRLLFEIMDGDIYSFRFQD